MQLRILIILCLISAATFSQKLRTDNMGINLMSYPSFVLPADLNTIEIAIINNSGNSSYQAQDMDWLKKTFYFDSALKVVPANGRLKLTFTINPDKPVSCSTPNTYCYTMENTYAITHRGYVLSDGVCTSPTGLPYSVSNTPTLDVMAYKVNVRDQLVLLCKKIRSQYDYVMNQQSVSFSRIKGDGFEKFDSLNGRMEDHFKAKKIRPPYAPIEELLNKSFDYYKVLAEKKVEDADKQKNMLFAIYSNEVILYSLIEKFDEAEKSMVKLEGLGMKESRTEYYKRFYNDRKNNCETYRKNAAMLSKNDLSYLYKDGKVPPPEEKKAVVTTTVAQAPKVKKKNSFNYAMTGDYFHSIPADKSDEAVITDLKENFDLNADMKRQSIENLLIQRRYKLGIFLIDSGFAHESDLSYMFRTPFSDGPKNTTPIYTKKYSTNERIDFVKEYMKRGFKASSTTVMLLDDEGASAKELQDFLIEQLDATEKNTVYAHYCYKAMESNNTEMFKSYIDKGVKLDPQYVNISGSTNIEIMKMWQAQGVDLNANNPYGQTTLRLAIESGKPENIKFLLEQGCDPCRKDNSGKNALAIAKKVDSFKSPEIKNEIVELLKQKTENCK